MASKFKRIARSKLALLLLGLLALVVLLAVLVYSEASTVVYWRLMDAPYFLYYLPSRFGIHKQAKILRIPRRIYQTWYTRDNLHPAIRHKITRMKLTNPSYEYTLFTDDEMDKFVRDNFAPDIVSSYNRLAIVTAKADFWRYLILYKNGGVYIDFDGAIVGNLDDLFNPEDDAVVSEELDRPFFIQWALAFKPNHPILKKTIDLVMRNIRLNTAKDGGQGSVHSFTGPTVFSEAIHLLYQQNYKAPFNHSAIGSFDFTDVTYHINSTTTTTAATFRLVGWRQIFQRYFRFKQFADDQVDQHLGPKSTHLHWREQELSTPITLPPPIEIPARGQ